MWSFVRKQWLTLLLSLVLGTVLWVYAGWVVTQTMMVQADFQIINRPSDVEITMRPEIKRVAMILRGPTNSIREARDLRINFPGENLLGLTPGEVHHFNLEPGMVMNLPPEVKVIRFDLPEVNLTVRPLGQKLLSVAPPEVVGTPAPGYEVYERKILGRQQILVRGPADVLEKLPEVRPVVVDVTNRLESYLNRTQPIAQDYIVDGKEERVTPSGTVEVLISVRRKSIQQALPGVRISALLPPGDPINFEITSDNPVTVTLEGTPEALATVTPDSFYAFIDLRQRSPKDTTPFKEPLIVRGLPEGVRMAKPEVVSARILPPKPSTTPASGTTPP